MSVYDVNGNRLNADFDVEGNELSETYDVDGNLIFSASYSIDNVELYYQSRTLEVADQINALSDEWQSFIFVTDPHYTANEMHSQAVALYLLSNSSASMLILGGDYCEGNWAKSRFNTWTSEFRASADKAQVHCLFGNHERFGGSASLLDALDAIYNAFVVDKISYINGSPENDYYYFDNTSTKTRFVFLNTSDAGTTTISSTQLSWVETAVQLPDATWSVVVLAHVNMMVGTGLLTNKTDLINAIKQCNGSVVGYICGHQHLDAITKISDGFYELTLLCDRYSAQYPDNNGVPREAGTYTENVVSVVSFNTVTKQVVMRRVGAGLNQTLNYEYGNTAES